MICGLWQWLIVDAVSLFVGEQQKCVARHWLYWYSVMIRGYKCAHVLLCVCTYRKTGQTFTCRYGNRLSSVNLQKKKRKRERNKKRKKKERLRKRMKERSKKKKSGRKKKRKRREREGRRRGGIRRGRG